MTGQFGLPHKATLLGLFLLLSGLFAHAAPVPMPKLQQSLDLQQHYRNALRGEEVIELTTDNERFIALWLRQRTADPQGGLLILHDVGHTPNWPFLLQQAREYLPDVGWSTLAIDLPTPSRDALGMLPLNDGNTTPADTNQTPDERTTARLRAGISRLNSVGDFNIAIVGFGDGAYWGARYLAENLSEEELEGYALVMVEAPLNYPDLDDHIEQLQIPILDLYMAESDFAHRQARERKAVAARAKNEDYLQIHDAPRQQAFGKPSIDRTTRRIWGWLRENAAGGEAQLKAKPAQ